MSQVWTVTWVGDNTKPWKGNHGNFIDYFLKLDGYDHTVKLTQKPETDPPRAGDTIYGGIVVDTVQGNDGPFESHKLKKERRPDDAPPHKMNVRQARLDANGKGDEFWAQKDKRIARAGVVQAVVASGVFQGLAQGGPEKQDAYVNEINRIADKLLASLDEATPHPNKPKAEFRIPSHSSSSGQSKGGAAEKAAAPKPAKVSPGDADRIIERCKALDPTRWQLELIGIADGIDLTEWQDGIRNLTPAQASKFEAKLDDIAQEEKVPVGGISDDDGIPF